jgi:acyl-CoA thioester hydrolase
MWSQIDANMHLRHSAYADFAAQARLSLLEKAGLNTDVFRALKVGPVLFREELIYYREISANDAIKISCLLIRAKEDGSRWSFRQDIFRSDGVKAATVTVDGAWIDTETRKLTVLPASLMKYFNTIPKSEDFIQP